MRIVAIALLFKCGSVAIAQTSDIGAPKRATAKRITMSAPRIDGQLNDDAWRDAVFFSDFTQKEPVEGAAPSELTEVAVMYDEHALYIGARMHRNDPSLIHTHVTRRDAVGNTERLIVSFDTYHDHRTASSAYLVWQRSSGSSRSESEPVKLSHWIDAITARGEQVIALKFAYWLPVE